MLTKLRYSRRVRKSAKLLDAYGPADWRSRIDPATLRVEIYSHCVLGQLYGDYTRGLQALSGAIYPDLDLDALDFYALLSRPDVQGFRVQGTITSHNLDLLNRVWRKELTRV